MAQLGSKQRPAIVRVQTEARAQEVASIFAEYGWQFILGIEPDKPENISDLKRLLKSKQVPKAKRVGSQTASAKTWKSHSRRNNNPPLRSVRTGGEKTKLSVGAMKVSEEKCEYITKTSLAILPTIMIGTLSVFLFIKFLTTMSMWYLILLILPLLFFLGLLYAIILNQKVILQGRTITILRRLKKPITAYVADALYQIIIKKGIMYKFRFRFNDGQRVAEVTPSVYENGDQLLKQLETIIEQENIDADVIER
jgi:hypothetical protein